MKNLKSAEICLISGAGCKTTAKALNLEANAYIGKMPKPRPGTCTIDGDVDVPGFKNIGGMISGRSFTFKLKGIEFTCKCSEEYPHDIFTTEPYVAK